MCLISWSTLIRFMACHLFGETSFRKPIVTYYQLDVSVKFESSYIFRFFTKCIWKFRLQNDCLLAALLTNVIFRRWEWYRYTKIRVAHAPGMPGMFTPPPTSRKPLFIDPGMHHGTCMMHVPWCVSGSLTRGGGENITRYSRRRRNPQFCVSGMRPMVQITTWIQDFFQRPWQECFTLG